MPKFAVEQITQFGTTIKVCKLYRDDQCKYDEFRAEIKDTNLESELGDLYAIIRKAANKESLPKTKFRKLKLSKKLSYAGYEAKSDNLRLYLFIDGDFIMVLGGKKGDQSQDIDVLEKTIKEYTEFIKKK